MHACQALLSYSLIIWVCLRITLAVVCILIKVNVMRITLHKAKAKMAMFCEKNREKFYVNMFHQ